MKHGKVMKDVKLYTGKDEGYVTTVAVPYMTPPPSVIFWGERAFVIKLSLASEMGEEEPRYVEGLVWHAIVTYKEHEKKR